MDLGCAASLHIHPLYVRKGNQCISSPSLLKGSAKISISDRGPRFGHVFFFVFLLLQSPTSSSPEEKSEEIHAVTMKYIRVLILLLLMGSTTPVSSSNSTTVPATSNSTQIANDLSDETVANVSTSTAHPAATTLPPTATTKAPITTLLSTLSSGIHVTTPKPPKPATSPGTTSVGTQIQNLTTSSSTRSINTDVSISPGLKTSSNPNDTEAAQGTTVSSAGNETKQDTQHKSSGRQENASPDHKGAGSDKRLWWILLPAGLVVGVVALFIKFKSKKIHDHTETIDTGTENASFQSRPESTKDGVMLLGVKSSGSEENAAAR
ncbi:A-agglutinin anchorage subunit-like isoform X3 [Girardinichthys multiradiatus]|uniref:A-agglutinin anchorage subunit-like isoform X3 n=1 Tax=Girardinichthys multiradiatus TaxID=208333 RepID=UPI001FAC2CA5|nr:A-agglutinin anchorage subunit-like isoform X3 [Girardinichthys multiradiatus]